LLPIIKEGGYTPINFFRVDGLYKDRTNSAEADKVVEILNEIVDIEKGICPSVGIATLNIPQRNLIFEKMNEGCKRSSFC
jgi:hypothetical protein